MCHRATSFPNPFPQNLTLEEVTNAVKHKNFFKRIERDSFITFDYHNSGFPMTKYKKVYKDPTTAPDENTKRTWQILRYVVSMQCIQENLNLISECRGLKFSKTGQLLCRPFHKFFSVNELPGAHL